MCVFAYGQTGSGKTFTIQGTPENPGIVPRALDELFSLKTRYETQLGYTVTFECYIVELYLDQLHDLLCPTDLPASEKPRLELREDPETKMINILNVQQHALESFEEAQAVYELGIRQRKTACTAMNEDSSRSHFIFSVIVNTFNHNSSTRSTAKISFVDLAGSERVKKTNPTLAQQKEANEINKSLLSLKEIIRKLSEGASSHVPYRDNKLTQLMRDSIGGNSKTLMFVNVSPADYNAQETKLSLFFGESAKKIKNNVQKNVDSQEVARLKEENAHLRRQLHHQPSSASASQSFSLI